MNCELTVETQTNVSMRENGQLEAGWFGESNSFLVVDRPRAVVPHSATVLLVGPIGAQSQGLCASLRLFRERLVAAGHTVLQVDPPGTGFAAIDGFAGLTWTSWTAAVRELAIAAATQWPEQRVVTFGVQLGAAVALEVIAGSEHVTEDLIAWAPITNGRRFLRTQRLLGEVSIREGFNGEGFNGEGINGDVGNGLGVLESAGHCYSTALQDSIEEIDLAGSVPNAVLKRALVIDRDDVRQAESWVKSLEAQGVDVCSPTVPGFRDCAADDPETGSLPVGVAEAVCDWLLTLPSPGQRNFIAASTPAPVAGSVMPRGHRDDPIRGIQERVVMVEKGLSLFTIEARPLGSEPGESEDELIFLLSTGSNSAAGPGRLHVEIGRSLAAQGATVIICERRGIGLSEGGEEGREKGEIVESISSAYDPVLIDDLGRLVKAAASRRSGDPGLTPVSFIGICSGATLAYRYALTQSSRVAIRKILCINQILFEEGASDVLSASIDAKVTEKFSHAVRRPSLLIERLKQGNLDVVSSIRRVAQHVGGRAIPGAKGRPGSSGVQQIRSKGIELIHIFDNDEPGIHYLKMLTHPSQSRSDAVDRNIVVTSGAGHTFGPLWSKEWLITGLCQEFKPES